ncbi:MAG: hypothetical protein KY455_12080 [Euryarchaeota archaeon]|nr:hypothetical protein [Euryarchaeota archaeon]
MRFLLAVVLLAPALLLSGCLSEEIDGLASARVHLETAGAEAKAWNGEALLLGVMAVEPSDAERLANEEDAPPYAASMSYMDDPFVGDGLAQAWLYLYGHDEEAFLVVVDHNGRVADTLVVTEENEETLQLEDVTDASPLGPWHIDSDEAARRAAAEVEGFAALAGRSDGNAFVSLHRPDDTSPPLWFLGLWSRQGDGAYVAVDAVNGTVYTEDTAPEVFASAPMFEDGRMAGEVTVLDPVAEHPFTLEGHGHHALYVGLARGGGTPFADLQAWLVSPTGEEHPMQVRSYLLYDSWDEVLLEYPTPGEWTVRVEASFTTVQQEYDLRWCTWDGEGDEPHGSYGMFGFSSDPCDELADRQDATATRAGMIGSWPRH